MAEFDPIAYINEPRWQESRLGLERVGELLERMGRPQDRLRFVHVAGTNGKGSTCAYLASILQAAGYRVGLFTSPYIIEFEERIRVNGRNIDAKALRDVTLFVREHAEAMAKESATSDNPAGEHPTEFELMTAVAFEHFAREKCDIVVCEVGLGGRLDSTNIIDAPEACVLCRIGLDHTELLGDTVAAVAREKAGIIKRGTAVVSWPQEPEAQRVIDEVAASCGVPVTVPDFTLLETGAVERGVQGSLKGPLQGSLQDPLQGQGAGVQVLLQGQGASVQVPCGEGPVRPFSYRGQRFTTTLLGSYQPSNAALAIETARVLAGRGWNVAQTAIDAGIAAATWPGRFQIAEAGPPAVIVDGGHNPQGAAVLAESLRDLYPQKADRGIVFLMSVLADKDYPAMIAEVAPLASAFVCATPPNPRALSAEDLAAAIPDDIPAIAVGSFPEAMAEARKLASPEPDGVICAFGSLYSISSLGV